MVMVLFYYVGLKANIKQHRWVLLLAYYIITAIIFVAMRDFRIMLGDQGALADIYYVVTLLPLVLLYTPRKLKLIPFILAFIVVSMTGKRGAFVAMALVMVIYFLIPYVKDEHNKALPNLIVRILVFAVVFALVWIVVNNVVGRYNLNIYDRLDKMFDDGGSGRIDRWTILMGLFGNVSNLFELLFGHGNGAVLNAIGGHAHNDFLEFFYDYGLFAGMLYVLFFISIIREGLKMYKNNYPYSREFMCSISIALCMSLYSYYAIDCTHITASSICFGLILADWYKFRIINYEQVKEN